VPIDLTALIDPHAQLPKYQQLAARIREAIDDGALTAGEEIPSEKQLRDATGMSREQVRRGIELLVNEGLVVRRHGAATRVVEAPPLRPQDASRYLKALRILKAGGPIPDTSAFTEDHGITWDEYSCDMTAARELATAEDARRLNIPAETPLLRRQFLKSGRGIPLQIQRSAMLWDLAGSTPVADPGRQPWPLGTIAELWSLGLEVTAVDEDVRSRQPRDEERRTLAMQTPGPVFDIVRVFWVGDRPVEASRVITPADRNVLHYRVKLDLTDPS
jgi:GntR family transcriptional regulator